MYRQNANEGWYQIDQQLFREVVRIAYRFFNREINDYEHRVQSAINDFMLRNPTANRTITQSLVDHLLSGYEVREEILHRERNRGYQGINWDATTDRITRIFETCGHIYGHHVRNRQVDVRREELRHRRQRDHRRRGNRRRS